MKEQTRPKVRRIKEIIKITAEINEIETWKVIERIDETKSLFFQKINKVNSLARVPKKETSLKYIKLEMKEEKSMKLLPVGFNPTEILNVNSLLFLGMIYISEHIAYLICYR